MELNLDNNMNSNDYTIVTNEDIQQENYVDYQYIANEAHGLQELSSEITNLLSENTPILMNIDDEINDACQDIYDGRKTIIDSVMYHKKINKKGWAIVGLCCVLGAVSGGSLGGVVGGIIAGKVIIGSVIGVCSGSSILGGTSLLVTKTK